MKCSSVMRIRVISLIFLNQPRISDLFIRESAAERGLQKFTWGFSKMKLFILLKLITIVTIGFQIHVYCKEEMSIDLH